MTYTQHVDTKRDSLSTPSRQVGVRQLRANLSSWLKKVKEGKEEIIVTERGIPIARIIGPSSSSPLDRLIAAGIVTPAKEPKTPMTEPPRAKPKRSVVELMLQMKRERPY